MKTVLYILGAGAIGYAAYLYFKKGQTATAGRKSSGGQLVAVTGPSITSTAQGVDNGASGVQLYNEGYNQLFPPQTLVMVPGAGSLDNIHGGNVASIVKF